MGWTRLWAQGWRAHTRVQDGTWGYGMGKGKEPGARGGVVRSSAVKRFAAWECEDAEVI